MPEKLRCIAVEDELVYRKAVQSLIDDHPQLELLGVFETPEQVRDKVDLDEIDLALLDIMTPGQNGMDFAKQLRLNGTEVIFTTAMINMAVQAFEIQACDYLVKPLSKERFEKAVSKALAIFAAQDRSANNSSIHNIMAEHIHFIEKDGDYIRIVHDDGNDRFKFSLRKALDLLDAENIVRIHKSYLVNLDRIEKVKKDLAYIGDQTIPVSRQGKSVLVKKMKIW